MTLVTPVLSNINTIDPSVNQKILFSYSGGQIEKKRLIITDLDGVSVYNEVQTGMQLSYEIPANTLLPGQYLASIQVYDYDENSSEPSSPVLFYCFSAPVFQFDGLSTTDKNKINSPNITVKVTYSQTEGEMLHSLIYYLYDEYHTLLSSSDTLYILSDHTFYGLDNLGTYYVRAVGTTAHGIKVDTGYLGLSVQYATISNNVLLNLTNDRWNGYITIDCNIIDVEYDTEGEYEVKDGILTVKKNGKIVYHLNGDPKQDFSIFLKAKKVIIGKGNPFFEIALENEDEIIFTVLKIGEETYCEMRVASVLGDMIQYCKFPSIATVDNNENLIVDENGNYIQSGTYNDNIFTVFEFKRKNNLYGISVTYENDEIATE